MKAPKAAAHAAGGKMTKAKDKSGVNKPMAKAKVPQKRPGVTVGVPTPTQKM